MKKLIISLTIILLATIGTLSAQLPPHPNSGNNPGSGNTPVGGASPLGGGLIILASLGIGYSLRKIYSIRSASENEELAS